MHKNKLKVALMSSTKKEATIKLNSTAATTRRQQKANVEEVSSANENTNTNTKLVSPHKRLFPFPMHVPSAKTSEELNERHSSLEWGGRDMSEEFMLIKL